MGAGGGERAGSKREIKRREKGTWTSEIRGKQSDRERWRRHGGE